VPARIRSPRNGSRRGRPRSGDGAPGLPIHELDDLDRTIVAALQENGRRPNVAIARALHVTETTVRHRIERLISSGFLRVAAVIDPRKTAYQLDVLICAELERERSLEAARRIAAFPNVVYVGLTSGRWDVVVEALFHSDEELLEFLTRKLTRAIGVRRTETYHVLRILKLNYDWKVLLDRRGRSSRDGLSPASGPLRAGRRAPRRAGTA
jgi:Lrp/AsnC family transcriptional regulator for asnA, asnC and gidA